MTDEEIVIALPPREMDRVVAGLLNLKKTGLQYPIRRRAAELDLTEATGSVIPRWIKIEKNLAQPEKRP